MIREYFNKDCHTFAKYLVTDLHFLWDNYEVLKAERHPEGKSNCSNCTTRLEGLSHIIQSINNLRKLKKFCEELRDKITNVEEDELVARSVTEIQWLNSVPPYCLNDSEVVEKLLIHAPPDLPPLGEFIYQLRKNFRDLCSKFKRNKCYPCDKLSQTLEIIKGHFQNLRVSIELLSFELI